MILRYILFSLFISMILVKTAFGAPQKNNGVARESAAPPINILSIIPAQGEPGVNVTLYGSGFIEETTAFLGNIEISTEVIGPRQLTFEIPMLAPGLYALYLKRPDGSTSRIYNFNVIPLKPIVTDISPDKFYSCNTSAERQIRITGRNFQPGTMVLFDGAAIRSSILSPEEITFTAPDVAPGLHQVQVKNPEDTYSTVMALLIDGKPEITSISQGEEYVNSYNLVIYGRNFLQNSSLVVDGQRIGGLAAIPAGREKFTYVDCNQIIYERYPYDTTPKNIRLQIINPNGESSPVVQITAP